MQDVLHYILTNIQTHWSTGLTWIAGGGGVWLVTQITKNLRNWEKSSTIQKFVLLASFLGGASDWFLANYHTSFAHAPNPFVWFPAATAFLFTLATFIHHTPLKQVAGFVSNTVQPYFAAVKELKATKAVPQTPAATDSFQ